MLPIPENGWVKNTTTVSLRRVLEVLARLQEYVIHSVPEGGTTHFVLIAKMLLHNDKSQRRYQMFW